MSKVPPKYQIAIDNNDLGGLIWLDYAEDEMTDSMIEQLAADIHSASNVKECYAQKRNRFGVYVRL